MKSHRWVWNLKNINVTVCQLSQCSWTRAKSPQYVCRVHFILGINVSICHNQFNCNNICMETCIHVILFHMSQFLLWQLDKKLVKKSTPQLTVKTSKTEQQSKNTNVKNYNRRVPVLYLTWYTIVQCNIIYNSNSPLNNCLCWATEYLLLNKMNCV